MNMKVHLRKGFVAPPIRTVIIIVSIGDMAIAGYRSGQGTARAYTGDLASRHGAGHLGEDV